MQNISVPGRRLLKITGVLKIVLGCLIVACSIYCIIYGITSTREFYASREHSGFSLSPIFTIAGVIGLIWSLFDLAMGIVGATAASRQKRANVCLVLAIISISFFAVFIFPAIVILGGFGLFFFSAVIIGTNLLFVVFAILFPVICLTLHILYLVGAIKSKRGIVSQAVVS